MFGINLNDMQLGYLSLIMGGVLLLQSLGILTSLLNGIVFFFALFLIFYGIRNTHVTQLGLKKIKSLRGGRK